MMMGPFVQSSDIFIIFPQTVGISFFGKSVLKGAPSRIDHAIIDPVAIASVVPEILLDLSHMTILEIPAQRGRRRRRDVLYSDQDGVGHV